MDMNVCFQDAPAAFAAAFDEAVAASATAGSAFFLDRRFIEEACREVKLPEDASGMLFALLETLGRDDGLRRTAMALHGLCFGPKPVPPGDWPAFSGPLLENENAISLLLVLSGLPQMRKRHDARRVPGEVRAATLSDIPLWLGRLKEDTGRVGLSRRILSWIYGHLMADLYRLGRLQFNHRGKLHYPCTFYRNRKTGRVTALAEAGARIDANGFLLQPGDELAWTATFEVDARQIRGFRIEPRGVVSRKMITLDAGEWGEAIPRGAPVLDVHIPEGEPLTVEACHDSFEQALRFFPEHYPELAFRGFTCASWLFDPVFLEILKPGSNIVAFYKEFYCVPLAHGICTDESLRRVFGKDKARLDDAPKDTSMKRALYAHYKRGGIFRASGGLILREDIPAYGRQQYWRAV